LAKEAEEGHLMDLSHYTNSHGWVNVVDSDSLNFGQPQKRYSKLR